MFKNETDLIKLKNNNDKIFDNDSVSGALLERHRNLLLKSINEAKITGVFK